MWAERILRMRREIENEGRGGGGGEGLWQDGQEDYG